MYQQPNRRSKRTSTRRREHLNSSSNDSSDSSISSAPVQAVHKTVKENLSESNSLIASNSLMKTSQFTNSAETITQQNLFKQQLHSKSVPSFAETQLLSVYYLNRNTTDQPIGNESRDNCIFVEQQERKPIRYSATYDPLASTKSTQTSPLLSLKKLSTHGSTLVVDSNQQSSGTNNCLYEQRLKVHSGSQRLANNPSIISETDDLSSPSELVEESRYSYEEYIIHVDNNDHTVEQRNLPSSSSPTTTSSVTTIIAQPLSSPPVPSLPKNMHQLEEPDSDRTSRLSGDEIVIHSSTSSMSGSFTNQDWPTAAINASSLPLNNAPIVHSRQPPTNEAIRVSSWPPAPRDSPPVDTQFETSFILDESDEQRRPSRVQFAEQLVHVIPPSATNSLSEESSFHLPSPPVNFQAPAITPRTSTNRTLTVQQNESTTDMDLEDDDTTTNTTTSSNDEVIPGRLQRTAGLTDLTEVIKKRPTAAPPPPPPSVPRSTITTTTTTTTTATATTSVAGATEPSSGVDPHIVRDQLKRFDYQLAVDTRPPINQSKWVKEHMDVSEVQKQTNSTTPGRVGALRSLFEQQSGRSSDSSTLNSPTGQVRRKEPEERPSRHGDEIRFRVKQSKISNAPNGESVQTNTEMKSPAKNVNVASPLTWEDLVGAQETRQENQQQSPQQQNQSPHQQLPQQYKQQRQQQPRQHQEQRQQPQPQRQQEQQWSQPQQQLQPQRQLPKLPLTLIPFELDEVQHIIGRRIKSFDEIGHYSQSDQLWKWDSAFWSSLTPMQCEQLRRLQQSRSRQDSGDTQMNEHSDRSAYQGDSEDNTPRPSPATRRIRSLNSSLEDHRSTPIVETKHIQSTKADPGLTVSVSGAGAWQQHKQSTVSTGIGRYTEASTIHESQPSVSVFGSTPNGNYTRNDSQESITSPITQQRSTGNTKLDNQTTIIESGYSSADEPQQRTNQFRPKPSTIIEESMIFHHSDSQNASINVAAGPSLTTISSNNIQSRESPIYENLRPELIRQQQNNEPEFDPLSYEQFISEYFSAHAKRARNSDGTLLLIIDGQQIQMSHIRLPTNDNLILSRNVYLDAIDEYPAPFETENDQLVIFLHGEPITLPADRWLFFKRKYQSSEWVKQLERVNRRVPANLMPIIENWLAEHTTFVIDRNEINVDGLNIPLTGRLGAHILDLNQINQLQTNDSIYWSEILKYLIRTGYVSFDEDEQFIHIGHSELDARRILSSRISPSPELIERLANLLRSLEDIQFDTNGGSLILNQNFIVPNEYIRDLFENYQSGHVLNANELANILLRVCDREEDDDGESLILSLNGQILRLTPRRVVSIEDDNELNNDNDELDDLVYQWLSNNVQWSSENGQVFVLRYRTMPNYFVRITGEEGLHLSTLLQRQSLDMTDLLEWHKRHARIEQIENSLRITIKPNKNIEIDNLPLDENEKNRGKVKSTNQKNRNMLVQKEGEEEKSLVVFIPFQQQTQSDSEQEKEEREYHHRHSTSTSPLLQLEEQKKIKANDSDEERALFLESISSLLHFVNANGSNVGTLELIQGRRLRLSLTDNSPFSQQQQQIEFNDDDTKILCLDLDLDINSCAQYLVDFIFDNIQFDKDKQNIIISYHNQMFKIKNLKQKVLQPAAKKLRLTSNKSKDSSSNKTIDQEEINSLTQWLDQLNRQGSITITDQNDIVIFPNGEEDEQTQILINHDDVDKYMENKSKPTKANDEAEVIVMNDIAHILLLYGYVQFSEGQLVFGTQRIALDRNELFWLRSIIQGVRTIESNRETEIDLFDGENQQTLHVPYEHMPPTADRMAVANYLFANGSVRYDVDTGSYAYRYIPPDIPLDDDLNTPERIGQRQTLVSHIRHVHVDEDRQLIELEFIHDQNNRLQLPARWFRQVASHRFDRGYIIDMLLANGGTIQDDIFLFSGHNYSLQVPRVLSSHTPANLQSVKLSGKQKQALMEKYVEYIVQNECFRRDDANNLLAIINDDDTRLYLTPEHTKTIERNQFRRQDVVSILNKHGEIKQDEFGNWLLYYDNQCVQLPPSVVPSELTTNKTNVLRSFGQLLTRPRATNETDKEFRTRLAKETKEEFLQRYHQTINYMYNHDLITCNRRLKNVQLHFSNQTLTIPLDQLRSILDKNILNDPTSNRLPFRSQQLSQWLLDNSSELNNTREGFIQLKHKNRTYQFPLFNPNGNVTESQAKLSSIVDRFGVKPRDTTVLSKVELTTEENQRRCAAHLIERLDQLDCIKVDSEARTLTLTMAPEKQYQDIIIRNPVIPVTPETLVNYLTKHGRFSLSPDRADIEYRHYDDGRIYRFNSFIHDWNKLFLESDDQRTIRLLADILLLNARFLQRANKQILISLRNGENFVIPSEVGSQLMGPVNSRTIADLLFRHADEIREEEDGKFLVVKLADQTLRLQQQRQIMSTKPEPATTPTKTPDDRRLKLLFPFNKSLRQIQKTSSSSTLNVQPPDASNGYAMDPLLMLANYVYRAGSLYQDDLGRLVIKMNEHEIVIPRIEAINAIETINTAPHRAGTVVARLIDRIGKVQSNKAGGLIITIGKSSFEIQKELIDRANRLHYETVDKENDLIVPDQDLVQTGLNGSMTLTGRPNRNLTGPVLLPSLRLSKSVGSLSSSTIGHPWFTDDQQMLYTKDGRGDARYLNLDNYPLSWQKKTHKHGIGCEKRAIRDVAPYLDVLGYVEDDHNKGVTISDLARIHPGMLDRGNINDNNYLAQAENDRARVQTKLCPKPRIIVIPDDETMLSSSDRKTRFYVQYMYDHDAVLGTDPAYVMMLPSRYPVRPTQPRLIVPHHYRDISLRQAPVYVHRKGQGEVRYEDLAQYLSSEPDLPSYAVRRMLEFDNRDEYREYLSHKLPAADVERLVRESEIPLNEIPSRYSHVTTRTGGSATNLVENENNRQQIDVNDDFDYQYNENDNRRLIQSPHTYYNIQNGPSNASENQTRTVIYQNTSLQPHKVTTKITERSPSTTSADSDMVITNAIPARRTIFNDNSNNY